MCELAQVLAKPAPERHAEACLAASRDLRRKIGGKGSPQRDLPGQSACLQRRRQREAELDDTMVEQGRSQLQRMGHRRDVGLRQQVAREVGLDVEQLQAGEARLRRLEPNLSRHVRGPQSASQREWKDLHQSGVTLAIGRGGDVEQAGCTEER